MNHYINTFIIIIALIIVSFSLKAQNNKSKITEFKAIPVTSKSKNELHKNFKKYSLFSLNTRAIKNYTQSYTNENIEFSLYFPEVANFIITLKENEILAQDYKVIIASDLEGKTYNHRKRIAFQGKVTNDTNSLVSLTITNDFIYGMIRTNEKEYFIEPLQYISKGASDNLFVLYETKDVLQNPSATCGVIDIKNRIKDISKNKSNSLADAGDCFRVRIAIASDEAAVNKIGGAVAMENYNIALMNTIYPFFKDFEFPTNVELILAGQYISITPAADPYSNDCSSCIIDDQLDYFGEWAINGGFGGIDYDLAHNITDHFPPPGTVGLAYVGTIGNQFYNHGVTNITSYSSTWLTFIHELGHSFGMDHSFDEGQGTTGGFMDYGDGKFNGEYSWHPLYTETEFETEVNSAANQPLSSFHIPIITCSTIGIPIADFKTQNDLLCVNTSVQLTNKTLGGATSYNWTFSGGTPATSSDINPTVSFASVGEKTITLVATNGNGSNSKIMTKLIINDMVAASCVPSGTSSSNEGGPIFFKLNSIEKISGGAFSDGSHYQDFSCSNNTILELGTIYNVVTESYYTNITRNQLFIDYNNDGDFNDINELVYNGTSDNFLFTTPSATVIENQLLRARLIVKLYNNSTEPCYIPTNGEGQVEDYGVFFKNNSTLSVADNSESVFSVYPNPTDNGKFTIFMPNEMVDTKVNIYNSIGQLVFSLNLESKTRNSIDLGNVIAKGLYYVKIIQGDREATKKLIVQ